MIRTLLVLIQRTVTSVTAELATIKVLGINALRVRFWRFKIRSPQDHPGICGWKEGFQRYRGLRRMPFRCFLLIVSHKSNLSLFVSGFRRPSDKHMKEGNVANFSLLKRAGYLFVELG